MNEEIKNKLLRLEKIRNDQAELDREKKEIEAELIDELPTETALQGHNGYFKKKQRKVYEFSDNVEKMSDELKELKKQEKIDGTAEVSEQAYIEYRSS